MIQAAIQTDANTGNFALHSFFIKFQNQYETSQAFLFLFHSIMASLERKRILPHCDSFCYKYL